MMEVPAEGRIALAKKASIAAAIALTKKIDPYRQKYGAEPITQLSNVFAGAKQRCTNPNAISYSNYGGRGITFDFPAVRAAVEWVLDNVGPRPTNLYSIDRIDNSRGYEAGNLRWATVQEQARNKRVYKRTNNGERLRLLKKQRPDLTYETLRLWIVQGATDSEIVNRRKYARTSIRHKELWP